MPNIRKDEEMFRFLFVEGNAYYKQQLAEFLGMKDHHFDKYYREFKKEFYQMYPDYLVEEQRNKYVFHRFKYDSFTYNKNILLNFYRKNHFSKKEIKRTAEIIRTLADEPRSFKQLVEFIEGDEFTNRTSYLRSLDYLKNLHVVRKDEEVYILDNDILSDLSTDELFDLYSFVHFMSNTHVLSVPGYLLLDYLTIYLRQYKPETNIDIFLYRYVHFARILSEYKGFEILSAINDKKYISFHYYSKKQKQRAHTLTESSNKPPRTNVIPLFMIYEHQYGRWYLIGKNPEYRNISVFKLEGISELQIGEEVDVQVLEEERQNALMKYEKSWFVSIEPEVTVKLKFYFQNNENQHRNFIKKRVLREKPGGEITIDEQDPNAFIYRLEVNGIKEMKPWILSFGSSVEVLEPIKFRNEIAEEWKKVMEEYTHV